MLEKKMIGKSIGSILSDHHYVTQALQKGIHEALLRHKLAGNAICTSKDGQVFWIPPEKIQVDYFFVPSRIPKEVKEKIESHISPIKAWREYRGFSTAELANRVEVSRQYIHQLENNEKIGSILVLKKISEILGVSLEDIIPR